MTQEHLSERFWSKVDKRSSHECWEWMAGKQKEGYGLFRLNGKHFYAHRLAYMDASNCLIPVGMVIDHICHNRACCNPRHLQMVTQQQNTENRKGAQVGSISHIRGVSWHKGRNKWQVRVIHNNHSYSGGYFLDIHEAEKSAIALRKKLMSNNLIDMKEEVNNG